MSTKLMTIEEAAAHLGVSQRSVRKFISDGFLSTTRQPGSRRKWLQPLEVEELRKDRLNFKLGSRLTRKEFFRLRARVTQLEGQMEVVLRMLDAKSNPLNMDKDYASTLYEACVAQLHRGGWTADEISPWTQVFLRISEEDFRTVRDAGDDPKPWKPFLRLCTAMSAHIVRMEEYAVSLELQKMHRELAEGRRRLRVSAMVYAELYSSDLDRMLREVSAPSTQSMGDMFEHVLRKTG